MKKTVLVTGGAGFIGSNFVNYLHDKYPDYRVLVLDLLTYAGSVDNLPPTCNGNGSDMTFWYGDVRNASLVESLVAESNIIVHFAAETHVTRSIFDNFHFFETDVIGTQVVSNSILRHRDNIERFVHISTSEVYGTALDDYMSEDHPLLPLSPYASAKVGADRLVYSYWATYKIPVTIVRPFNNYGPRQHLEKLIPRFVTSCLLDEPLRVHGDGSAERDWIHVDDTCRAIDTIIHADASSVDGEVFNIGTGISLSILEIANRIVSRMNKSDELITHIGNRPGQVFRHTADRTKLERELGWVPTVRFDDGLDRTIKWYCENQHLWEKQRWLREIPIVTSDGNKELH